MWQAGYYIERVHRPHFAYFSRELCETRLATRRSDRSQESYSGNYRYRTSWFNSSKKVAYLVSTCRTKRCEGGNEARRDNRLQ